MNRKEHNREERHPDEVKPFALYETLGVSVQSSTDTVRQTYKRLARMFHPDARGEENGTQRMSEINAAYLVPSDPARRKQYDAEQTLLRARLQAQNQRNDRPSTQGTEAAMNTRQTTDHTTNVRTTDDIRPAGGEMVPIRMPKTPQMFAQLGILLFDGSSSMTEMAKSGLIKSQDVNVAAREFFTRFKVARNRANFSFAVVTFDHEARLRMGVTPAESVDDNADYDPTSGHGGGTYIGGALKEAKAIAERFLAGTRPDMPTSVVVLLMTDGECNTPAESQVDVDALKAMDGVTLCMTYFARAGQPNPAAQDFLRHAATDPVRGYKTVYDAETLRAFFIASLSAGLGV